MEIKCLSASGQLGYGIPEKALRVGVRRSPDVLAADMGSIDPGPFYLGSGQMGVGGAALRRDLGLVLSAARGLNVPLLIGSAGTAGASAQLDAVLEVVREVAKAERHSFRMAVIRSDVDRDLAARRLAEGRVRPCGPAGELTTSNLEECTNLVAQMGVEPFQRALAEGAEVVITGRACDTSMFAALPRMRGADPGLAMHLAKLIECTSLCAEPGGRDAALGTIRDGEFMVESMNPERRCTPVSVAAHSMYEQSNPFTMGEPGGVIDVSDSEYEQVEPGVVKVTGSRWVPSDEYEVKLEGARRAGFRCITIGGIRDPRMIAQAEEVAERVRRIVGDVFRTQVPESSYQIRFRRYGQGATMFHEVDTLEGTPTEMLVLIDVIGDTREIAYSVGAVAKQYYLHEAYPGMLCTSGNMALPFGPDVIPVGDAYEFCVYHLMGIDEPGEVFPIAYETV